MKVPKPETAAGSDGSSLEPPWETDLHNPDLRLLHALREEVVRRLFEEQVYARGERYYEGRRVRCPRRCGEILEAEVQGTELYTVVVRVEDGVLCASCTCPFALEDPCKHIAAVLLQWLGQPRSFAEVPRDELASTTQRLPQPSMVFGLDLDDVPPLSHGPPRTGSQPWWSERCAVRAAGKVPSQEPGSSLGPLLMRLTLNELREIARQRGWQLKGMAKEEYVQALSSLLTDPTEIVRAATGVPDTLRGALRAALVAEDGRGVSPAELAGTFTAIEVHSGRCLKPVEAAALLQDLARWGLVIPWRDGVDGLQRYLLPWEIQRHLPPLPGWCPQQVQPSALPELSPGDFVQRVYRVWQCIAALEPPCRDQAGSAAEPRPPYWAQGWPHDADEMAHGATPGLNRADSRSAAVSGPPQPFVLDDATLQELQPLTSGNREELEFICRLLLQLDALRVQGGRLRPQRDVMTDFLCRPRREQQAILVDVYLSLPQWSELDTVLRADDRLMLRRHPFAMVRYEQFRSGLVRLRLRLMRFLATAGEEGWCSIGDVEAALRSFWSEFFDPGDTRDALWQADLWWLQWRDQQQPLSPADPQAWRALQGQFLQVALEGPLFWFGLAELARQDGQLLAFRVRGLADHVWSRPLPPEETSVIGDAVVFDAQDLTIAVRPDAVPPHAHVLLASIARLEEARPGRFVYRPDMAAAHASFEQGQTLPDLLAAWEHSISVNMPPWLAAVLERWWSAYGQVRLYDGFTLLELSDDVALRELEASTSLAQRSAVGLSSRFVLVPEGAVDALLRELRDRGYTPKEVR